MIFHFFDYSVALCATLIPKSKQNNVRPVTPQQFPTTFKFGSASSAYQVEGAWNIDGKYNVKLKCKWTLYTTNVNNFSHGIQAEEKVFGMT